MNFSYLLLIWLTLVGVYHDRKPLPAGVDYQGPTRQLLAGDIEFIKDMTYLDQAGKQVHDQEIFNSIFTFIDSAQHYLLFDMFLFNSYKGPLGKSYRDLSTELADKLVKKKRDNPTIQIDFITDPVNTFYGGAKNAELERLKEAGINVIITDLTKLRDSTPVYSPIWRTFFKWLGNSDESGIIPHIFSMKENKVTLRSYLDFLNLKANHRKIFVADYQDDMITVITSANPHSASSDFSNVGIIIRGSIWQDIYEVEEQAAIFSGGKLNGDFLMAQNSADSGNQKSGTVALLTEEAILRQLVSSIISATQGDTVAMAMFYISNRKIVEALVQASENGATVLMIQDPVKDGFGYYRNGVPGRPVAHELKRRSKAKIEIRWYHTHGEQFHSKLTYIKKKSGITEVILGSANLTRKNIGNYNLETNVFLSLPTSAKFVREIDQYFNRMWYNRDGYFTADYSEFASASILKKFQYRFQEFTGFATY